ncbi:transporter [Streptomyces sp. NPDC002817]|uniref:transporter n=1 Tax=Streptomyces sp. NPDC088357 TaxID=3154655 RepID=UPI00342C4ECC
MPTIADRIRNLAERRAALSRPHAYEHLPAITDGIREPSSLDIALIAIEADVLVELLLGTSSHRQLLVEADFW